MDSLRLFLFAIVATSMFAYGSARAVNISNTWMLPEEGFPVFYRYFRDRISWYEADAVCQFHHANLVTVDSTSEYDAVRAYLKELDISYSVWIGLSKNNDKSHFTWTDFRPLSNEGHWQEAIPVGSGPLCAATDPSADFRWHALQCGGPEVASFICELPVPTWATSSKGCLLTELPSLTVLYIPEQSAIELTSDCGLDGTKRIACKGNADREEMLQQLSCGISNDDFDEKSTKGSILSTTESSSSSLSSAHPSADTKTTKPWIWTSNTIPDTGDYGSPTRHRRETENTLAPAFSTSGTTDLAMREKAQTTAPSVFKVHKATENTNAVTLDSSIAVAQKKQPNLSNRSDDISSPTSEAKDEEEYSGVINQGQLFSIIENGTIFDVIELNETGTEEPKSDYSTTQSNLYTTVIYHKEPPEDLKPAQTEDQKVKQEVTPTFKAFEPKASFQDKSFKKTMNDLSDDADLNKENVPAIPILSDSSVKLNRTYRKKVPLFEPITENPISKDGHEMVEIKLHDAKSNTSHTKLYITTKISDKAKRDKIAKMGKAQKEDKAAPSLEIMQSDEPIKTPSEVSKKFDQVLQKKDSNPKPMIKSEETNTILEEPKLDESSNNVEKIDEPKTEDNSTSDMETEVKETEIDPKIDLLNTKTNGKTNNESEMISLVNATPKQFETNLALRNGMKQNTNGEGKLQYSSSEEHFQGNTPNNDDHNMTPANPHILLKNIPSSSEEELQNLPPISTDNAQDINISTSNVQNEVLKKQFLPKQLLEDPDKEAVVEEPQEFVSTVINPTGDPVEQVPQQQPRPNRQRLLTKPQRRSFYPYFFSRVLG